MLNKMENEWIIPKFRVRHRVRLAREVAEMQQAELAAITGLSRASIANIEVGRTKPRKASLNLIAFATGVDPDWLETGEAPPGYDSTQIA